MRCTRLGQPRGCSSSPPRPAASPPCLERRIPRRGRRRVAPPCPSRGRTRPLSRPGGAQTTPSLPRLRRRGAGPELAGRRGDTMWPPPPPTRRRESPRQVQAASFAPAQPPPSPAGGVLSPSSGGPTGGRRRRLRMNAATPAAAPTPPAATPTKSAMGGPADPTTSVNESVSAVRRAVPFWSSAMNLYVWLPAESVSESRNTAPVPFPPPTYRISTGVPSRTRDTVGASPSRSTYRTEKRNTVRASPSVGSTLGFVRTGARFTAAGGGDFRTSYS